MEQRLQQVDVAGKGAEASALLPCGRPELLDLYGFDRGFWTVADEGPVEKCIYLVGRKAGSGRWKAKRLRADLPDDLRGITDDSEALARRDGSVWVLGSHFGAKSGPLEKPRAFAARFEEAAVLEKFSSRKVPMEIACRPFRVHRAVNDALADAGVDRIPLGPEVRQRFIADTLREAYEAEEDPEVRVEDWPLNIEGAAFQDDGSLLVALRFPVTVGGHPLLIELDGLTQWFDGGEAEAPLSARVAAVLDIGSRQHPVGIRGLQWHDGLLHALVGPLGSVDKENAVAMEYPGSRRTACEHHRFALPSSAELHVQTELVRRFETQSVEGLAWNQEGWHYAVDTEDGIQLLVPQG